MPSQLCITRLETAMEGASLEDQIRVAEEADRILKDSVGLTEEEIFSKLDASIKDQSIAKKIEGRNRALNSIAKRNMEQFVDTFEGDPALGIEALLVGINDVKMGARRSVAATQSQLQETYLAGLVNDLDMLGKGPFDAFTAGDMDLDISRALWSIDDAEALAKLPDDAVNIAKIINKYQEKARIDANNAGAHIRKLPGYITRQSHDMDKIRNAGFDEWRREIEFKLDERTFDGVVDREAFLKSVHRGLSYGKHLGNGSVPGLKGVKNIAKSASHERVLHFRSADDWMQYNERFGSSSLSESVMNGLRMSAQNTGIMKIMGPNAEANYSEMTDRLLDKLSKANDDKGFTKLEEARDGRLDNYIKWVTGEANIPASNFWASVGQGVRGYQSITKLGGAVISSIADIPIGASELRYQGKGLFATYAGAIKNAGGALGDMGKSIINRKLTVKNAAARRTLAELGVTLDATTGLFRSRFDLAGDAVPGKISNALNTFFRLNGLTLWTDSMRAGSMIGMAQHVGSYSKMPWGRIPLGLQETFTLYGIGKDEWNLIRSVGARKQEDLDGEFLIPDDIKNISDDLITAHLNKKGIKPTDYQKRKLVEDLEDSFRTYYVDRSQYAVIEPDVKTRAMMLRDTQPGTVAGELFRSFAQFKSFPIAIIQKVWGREIRGRRGRPFLQSATAGMAEVIVMSTLFGYIAMSAKDMVKNRTPRPVDNHNTWKAAFLQGGGAGIYGDFMFGEAKSRFGVSPISTLAGPTVSTAEEIYNLYADSIAGDQDAGKRAFKLLYQSAPALVATQFPAASVLNTAYAKMVLDHMIYYNVMESLSPGYKRRMEKRLKRENDQELLIR